MQDKRERYLSLMGIDTYQLRQPEETPADVVMAEETSAELNTTESTVSAKESEAKVAETTAVDEQSSPSRTNDLPTVSKEDSFMGLRYITAAPENGLLVVLPSISKKLEPGARQLMSKMLNAIQCEPAKTGFAEVGKETEKEVIACEGIKAILFLDYQAGKQFIDLNGAQRVAGEDHCDLNGVIIVISVHPQELLTIPELKATAWRDLKLIASHL